MEKYILLFLALMAPICSWLLAIDPRVGRFSYDEKCSVGKNSIFRKIFLRKEDKDYPLGIYKVIPWVISVFLLCVVLLLYIAHIVLYTFPIGHAIGAFLSSPPAIFFCAFWILLVMLYDVILKCL